MGTFRLVHIGAAAALSITGVTSIGVIQSMAATTSGASSFVPIDQCRLLDTRAGSDNIGARRSAIDSGETIVVDVHGMNGNCDIPVTATAISANVTSINPTASSFLTIYAAGVTPRPTVSSLNWVAGSAPTPNGVTIKLSDAGSMAIYNLAGTVDVVVDIDGYFEPSGSGDAGANGTAGVAGPIGPTGPTGGTGTNGAAGNNGLDGADGADGVDGLPGGDGADGVDGADGLPGGDGTDGLPGGDGSDGADGGVGARGTSGASGPQFGRLLRLSSVVDTAGNVGMTSSISTGMDGNPLGAYYDTTLGNLKVMACNDLNCADSNETLTAVDTAGDIGRYVSLTLSDDGYPIVAYYDTTNGNLKVVKCNDRACVGGDEAISTVDTVGNVGTFTSLTVGVEGLPTISYYDTTNSALKVAKCNDASCSGNDETITTVDNSGDVGQYSSITIGPDSFPAISYFDATSNQLKVAKCTNVACTSSTTTTVDVVGTGTYSTIAIGANGFPVIVYRNTIDLFLMVATCADPACASASINVLDDSTGNADAPSIAIGADGNPKVSYGLGLDLRLAECNDPACAGRDETITTLASGIGGANAATSITLGRDANPVIAYRDNNNQELVVVKVVHTSWTPNGWSR